MSVTRRAQFSELYTSSGDRVFDFGFEARRVQINLMTSGPLYLNFQATAASTSDFPGSTGVTQIIVEDGYAMGALALHTCCTGCIVGILALGG